MNAVTQLSRDVRYSLRLLARTPVTTLALVLSLGLGIGLNTAVFSYLEALFLRPVPNVHEPERIASAFSKSPSSPAYLPVSYLNYLDLVSMSRSFSALCAYQAVRLGLAGGSGEAEQINGEMVTGNYFEVLGLKASLGRTFLPDEDSSPNTRPVAVISEQLWRTRFGGDPRLVGRAVRINGYPFVVIGIAGNGYRGTSSMAPVDIWVPTIMYQKVFPYPGMFMERNSQFLHVLGRLEPGVSLAQARAEFKALSRQLDRAYPADNLDQEILLFTLPDASIPPGFRLAFQKAGILLLSTTGLVLLITCLNLGSLLSARAVARSREIGVRLALGATRGRLIRQLLTESFTLAFLGGLLSLLLGVWMRDLLWALRPPALKNAALHLALDGRVLLFTLAVSVLAGVIFGLAPALEATRQELISVMKDEPSTGAPGRRRFSGRAALVVCEVALCSLSLGCAGFFLKSLMNAQRIDPGFEAEDVLVFSFDLKFQGYDEEAGRRFQDRLMETVTRIPGVRNATLAENRLLGGFRLWETLFLDGPGFQGRKDGLLAGSTLVGPNYFETVGIPILHGRGFKNDDDRDSRPVVVINETMAKKLFHGVDPVGTRVWLEKESEPVEIIGIARNSKYTTIGEDTLPFLYLPLLQRYSPKVTIHVRVQGRPQSYVDTIQKNVRELDPSLPILEAQTVTGVIRSSLWAPRLGAYLLGTFGLVSLCLATVGVYGVSAQYVNRRLHEIGIRMALGAQKRSVLQLVLSRGMRAVAIGALAGLLGSILLRGLLINFLYDSGPGDFVLLPLALLVLACAGLLATLIPAFKAARMDPASSLRQP